MSALKKVDVWPKTTKKITSTDKDAQKVLPEAPYNDEITDAQMKAMNEKLPDEEFEGYEIVGGPAW